MDEAEATLEESKDGDNHQMVTSRNHAPLATVKACLVVAMAALQAKRADAESLYALLGAAIVLGICMWEVTKLMARWTFRTLGKMMKRSRVKRKVRSHLQRISRDVNRDVQNPAGPVPMARPSTGGGPQMSAHLLPKAPGQVSSAAASSSAPCVRVSRPALQERVSNPSQASQSSIPAPSTSSQGTRSRVAQAVQEELQRRVVATRPLLVDASTNTPVFGDLRILNDDHVLLPKRGRAAHVYRDWFPNPLA